LSWCSSGNFFPESIKELIWLALNRREEFLLGVITSVMTGQLRICSIDGIAQLPCYKSWKNVDRPICRRRVGSTSRKVTG
jgi:hypothetical protein